MDVRLPNGRMIRNIPEGTSKDEVMRRAISRGYATEADFGQESSGVSATPEEAMVPRYLGTNEIPTMIPKSAAEQEDARQEMLRVPGMDPEASIYTEKPGRAGTIAISAMTGAEIGRRASGPDPRMQIAGATLGGAVGAFGGSYGFDRTVGEKPPHESALAALREGELDATFGAGIPILANYAKVLGPAFAKVAGIDAEKANYLLETANKIEAKYGIVDAASNNLVKGTRTVLGVFPWIGTPFRRASQQSAEAIEKTIDSQLNRVAPNATLSQLGVDMTKAAERSYAEWKRTAGGLFDSADEYARQYDATVPAQPIIDKANAIGKRKNFPELSAGDWKDAGGSEITEFINNASNIASDRLTVEELRALETGAEELWTREISAVDSRRLMLLKEGIEEAWKDISVVAGKDKAQYSNQWTDFLEADAKVKENYDFAKSFYADGMTKFDTPTAKRFGRADKRLFRPGAFKSGTINEDEVARVAFNLKSPQAVTDLQALVGPENVRSAFRYKIDGAIEQSIVKNTEGEVSGFKWGALQKAMGLTGDQVEEEALEQVLKGSGVSAKDFYDVIGLGMQMEGAPNASKFVARRATLGGKGAVVTALGGGMLIGGGTGLAATVIPAVLTRYGATLLTRPSTLKSLLTTMDPTVKPALRRTALTRFMKMVAEMEDEEQPTTRQE